MTARQYQNLGKIVELLSVMNANSDKVSDVRLSLETELGKLVGYDTARQIVRLEYGRSYPQTDMAQIIANVLVEINTKERLNKNV